MRSLRLMLAVAFSAASIVEIDLQAQAAAQPRSGADVYALACVTCHAPDGRGASVSALGFDVELPDFTDCSFSTVEAVPDWHAVVELGGPVRRFNRLMPAFGEALAAEEIDNVIAYIRGFCRESGWPQGDLNLPRPLVTEKAFPENEAVLTTTYEGGDGTSVSNSFLYEHRLGSRGQYEVNVPFDLQSGEEGQWHQGLGDVAVAYKRVLIASMRSGSILSAGGEVTLPTGKESLGLGSGTTIVEPFAAFGQILSSDSFVHLHGGMELSTNHDVADDEAFVRAAAGRTFSQPGAGRAWSPIFEVLAARELGADHETEWDVVPQVQVTLSGRQHIIVNVGAQLPLNDREGRNRKLIAYLLWDWFDGGFFDGW
jgi:mono/diheme cytochrome c family protein